MAVRVAINGFEMCIRDRQGCAVAGKITMHVSVPVHNA